MVDQSMFFSHFSGPFCHWTALGHMDRSKFHGSFFSADPQVRGHVTLCLLLLLLLFGRVVVYE